MFQPTQPIYGAPTPYNGVQPNNFANPNQIAPPPQNQQVPIQSNCDFITAPGPEFVKDYIVRPNQKLFFLDSNHPILYVKEADSVGISKTEAMSLEKIDFDSLFPKTTQTASTGVTETEFKGLSDDIRNLVGRLQNLEDEVSQIKATKSDNSNNSNNQKHNRRDNNK